MHPDQLNFIGSQRVAAMADEARRQRLLVDTRTIGDDFAWPRPRRTSLRAWIARALQRAGGTDIALARRTRVRASD